MRLIERIPPSFFAIPFGLGGLASVWRLMDGFYGTPGAISDGLFVLAAAVWFLLAAAGLAKSIRAPRAIVAELRDPVLSPFWSLPWISGMVLCIGLEPHAYHVAKVGFLACYITTFLFGGWITGEWIAVPLGAHKFHPGYVLPTVAGGLVAAGGAAGFGLPSLGWLSFGVGIVSFVGLSALVFNRLLFLEMLEAALIPCLIFLVAPPAIAGTAYFELHGAVAGPFEYGLAGYTMFMLLVWFRLLPALWRAGFTAGFWSLTFPWSAIVVFAIRWLHIEHPAGETIYAALALVGVTLLVGMIAARSLLAVARGEFLPAVAAVPPPTEVPAAAEVPSHRVWLRVAAWRVCHAERARARRMNGLGPSTEHIARQGEDLHV
jgi:tellurite resistance protein